MNACLFPWSNLSLEFLQFTSTKSPPLPHRFMNRTLASIRRSKLLFFAGMVQTMFFNAASPHSDASYSDGVRQTVLKMYGGDPRFVLHSDAKLPNYYELMASATFCLAPLGLGWGARV